MSRWESICLRLLCVFLLSFTLIQPAFSQYRIKDHGVHSAAATREADGLAPGSAISIHGDEFLPEGVEPVTADQPYPTELHGIRVYFVTPDGETAIRAAIRAVSRKRIDAIVPAELQPGQHSVAVWREGQGTEHVAAQIVQRSFGIVTTTRGEAGPAVAWARRGDESVALKLTAPAHPGERIEILAAGLGVAEVPAEDVQIVLDGRTLPVVFAGKDAAGPGFDKIVFEVPAEAAPTGCAVDFRVRIAGVESRVATLPITAPDQATCRHPLDLDTETLKRLDDGGTVTLADFHLLSSTLLDTEWPNFSVFGGQFTEYDAPALAAVTGIAKDSLAASKGCVEIPDQFEFFTVQGGRAVTGPSALELITPERSVLRVEPNGYHYYSQMLESEPTPGEFLLRPEDGAYLERLRVSPPVTWTNRDEIAEVVRDEGLTVKWTAGAGEDVVLVNVSSRGPAPENPASTIERGYQCFAPASDGELTLSPELLKRLPAVNPEDAGSYGVIAVVHSNGRIKSAPLQFGFAHVVTRFLNVR